MLSRRRGRPASRGPSLPRRAAGLCLNGRVRLALCDHLAEGDLRRIRKRALQLLVAHPSGRNTSRLVGMRRRIEEANRGHDAVARLDQQVAVEPGQLAQLRDQRFVDLLRQLVGATGVDTLVASHGGMHAVLLTSLIRVGEPGRALLDALRPRVTDEEEKTENPSGYCTKPTRSPTIQAITFGRGPTPSLLDGAN